MTKKTQNIKTSEDVNTCPSGHTWGKWEEVGNSRISTSVNIEQNILLQFRYCTDCGIAEARKVV